jgi:hypothetical protein
LLRILTASCVSIATAGVGVAARSSKLDLDVLSVLNFHRFGEASERAIACHGHSLANLVIRAIDEVNGGCVLFTEARASHGDESST